MLSFASFLGLPLLVCGGLSVSVMAMASGAMHEDGLADTADGFGGGRDVDDKMRIMHDSYIGSYGVLALCISTIIRISLFASIAGLDLSNLALIGLVAAIAAAARWQILIALWTFQLLLCQTCQSYWPTIDDHHFCGRFSMGCAFGLFYLTHCRVNCWHCRSTGLPWSWQSCDAANQRH